MRRPLILCIAAGVSVGWLVGAVAQSPVKTLGRVQSKLSSPGASSAGVSGSSPAVEREDNMLIEGESLYMHMADRDPFTPLVRGAVAGGQDVKVRAGKTGLSRFTVEACLLEAILKIAGTTVAWFQGPDGKPYKVKKGEHFADGVVLDISLSNGEVTVQQELNDPTAIKPFRNLVLKIRNQEGEGQ